MYKQDPPNAVQIEPVEGCNLACSFCGIQGIRDNDALGTEGLHGENSKPFNFMLLDTARKLAKQLKNAKWNARLEFAMHGEPSKHPTLYQIIEIFRKQLPKSSIMITSNGTGFLKDTTKTINQLMESGTNVILLDNYDRMKTIKKIIERYKGPHGILYYPSDMKANPHQRRSPKQHDIVITEDVSHEPGGTHGKLMTHAACAFPRDFSLQGHRCARPFREISVRYDGNIALCCMDWVGIYKCGNIWDNTIDEIWQGPEFDAARKALYHGYRTFGPCYGCNTRSYRVGLLPDRMGKKKLAEPDKSEWKTIRKALKEPHYAEYIERPWMPKEKLVIVKEMYNGKPSN